MVGKKYYFGTFNNPMNVIGPIGDPKIPYPPKKPEPKANNCHTGPEGRIDPEFKPYGTNTNNKRVHDTFEKNIGGNKGAILVTKRKPPPPDDAPPPFKMTHNVKHVPVTSIATNSRNLKASYP